MKVKKTDSKTKKKKDSVPASTSVGIKKHKKPKKVKKIENNEQVASSVKKEFAESQSSSGEKLVSRQQRWNMYLIAFREHEKLPKKQRQILEFCTNKSTTPPKRKIRFLNFIRNCYSGQADVSDEQINELFDTILQKYNEYKSGNYHSSTTKDSASSETSPSPLSKNKKKKLRYSANASELSLPSPVKKEEKDDNWSVVKTKKKKRQKDSVKVKVEVGDEDEDDNVDAD